MKIEFENSIRRLSFLCRLLVIKIAWINTWLFSYQSELRSNHSTGSCLSHLGNHILCGMETGNHISLIFIDLLESFDYYEIIRNIS